MIYTIKCKCGEEYHSIPADTKAEAEEWADLMCTQKEEDSDEQ